MSGKRIFCVVKQIVNGTKVHIKNPPVVNNRYLDITRLPRGRNYTIVVFGN